MNAVISRLTPDQRAHIERTIKEDIRTQARALQIGGYTVEKYDAMVAQMNLNPYMTEKARAIRVELLHLQAEALFG